MCFCGIRVLVWGQSGGKGTVLLCPRWHSTNPPLCVMLLKHPSPCHEIFMPFSKQAPAQQICTALPSPAPFTPRQSVLQRGWLWALL